MSPSSMTDEGFAAVDAMVALAILATVVSLSLVAGRAAVRLSTAAAETRQAEGELRYLLAAAPRGEGVMSGKSPSFDWQVATRVALQSPQGNLRVCERKATLRSRATGRGYVMGTDEACPPMTTLP